MTLAEVNYEKYENRIPHITLETLRNYIEYGVPTGGFIQAVLTNNLFGAYGRADEGNRAALGDIVMFVNNEAPGNCWGSSDHVKEWLEKEGRQGRGAYVPFTFSTIDKLVEEFPQVSDQCGGRGA